MLAGVPPALTAADFRLFGVQSDARILRSVASSGAGSRSCGRGGEGQVGVFGTATPTPPFSRPLRTWRRFDRPLNSREAAVRVRAAAVHF